MISQQVSPSQTMLLTNARSLTARLGEERTRSTITLSIGTKKGSNDKRTSVPFGGPSVTMTIQRNPQKTTLQITARIFMVVTPNVYTRDTTPNCFLQTFARIDFLCNYPLQTIGF
jgi:hypothetical protein